MRTNVADYLDKLNEELLSKLYIWHSNERDRLPYQEQLQLLTEIRHLQIQKVRYQNYIFKKSLEE